MATLIVSMSADEASAAVPGLEVMTKVSLPSLGSSIHLSVTCTPGKELIGVGGSADVTSGWVGILDEVVPFLDRSGSSVVAARRGPGAPIVPPWRATVHAICADPLPGARLTAEETFADSTSPKHISVNCGVRQRLIGLGGQIDIGTSGRVGIETLRPRPLFSSPLDTIEIGIGTSSVWSAKVYGICVDRLPGLEPVMAPSPLTPDSPKFQPVECPPGKSVVSVGAEIRVDPEDRGKVVLRQLTPLDDKRGAVVGATEASTGTDNKWGVIAYALCASD